MNKYYLIVRYILIRAIFSLACIQSVHAMGDELEQLSSAIITLSQQTPEELDEEDFVMIPRDNHIPNSTPLETPFNEQEVEKELKTLITQGGASVLSGAFGFLAGNVLLQTGLGYVGYKLGTYILPPVLNEVSLPVRYARPFYQVQDYVYQKGTEGMGYLYTTTAPGVINYVKQFVPPPPPQEIEMDTFHSESPVEVTQDSQ